MLFLTVDLRPNISSRWTTFPFTPRGLPTISWWFIVSLFLGATYYLKLNKKEWILFFTTVRCCGPAVSADGSSFNPQRIDGIPKIYSPKTGRITIICLCDAMDALGHSRLFVRYSPVSRPTRKVYTALDKWTRLAAGPVSLKAVGWDTEHDDDFCACKLAL